MGLTRRYESRVAEYGQPRFPSDPQESRAAADCTEGPDADLARGEDPRVTAVDDGQAVGIREPDTAIFAGVRGERGHVGTAGQHRHERPGVIVEAELTDTADRCPDAARPVHRRGEDGEAHPLCGRLDRRRDRRERSVSPSPETGLAAD